MERLRISAKKQAILQQLNINTIQDLLHYYPRRYNNVAVIPFAMWKDGEDVCFEGILKQRPISRFTKSGRTMQTALVSWQEHEIKIVLFNQPWFVNNKVGTVFSFFGKLHITKANEYQVTITKYNTTPLEFQLGINAIYAKKTGISDKDLQKYIEKAYELEPTYEWIPEKYRQKYRLITKQAAIYNIHFPKDEQMLKESIRYLKYEEFLRFQLCIQKLNDHEVLKMKQPKRLINIQTILAKIPFDLTEDQKKVIYEIREDFKKSYCMYRILQGDVGSGKTIVAFLAMMSIEAQSALLAPTEILARQHYENIRKYTDKAILLIGSLSENEKAIVKAKIANNEVKYIIGTHAIIQDSVIYANLGFVIIDEQQRFGVNQRRQLLEKGSEVDVLIMSATPIPRTMALAIYSNTDISTIKTLPKAKQPIVSYWVKQNSIKSILKEVEKKIQEGEQCYIVCPAIEKKENSNLRNVEEVYHSFEIVAKGKYQVGLLHGKMKKEEQEKVMQAFLDKKLQVLVTTTVIEVGVDVKDANVMVIYDAHRFGLSQLHQLRGRCARGVRKGYCYFLSDSQDELAQQKLQICVDNTDGFLIAEQDLKLRGPGDVLGVRQSGVPNLVLGDVFEDMDILTAAQHDALEILQMKENYPYIEHEILDKIKEYID